jgi:hypothetical protein
MLKLGHALHFATDLSDALILFSTIHPWLFRRMYALARAVQVRTV